MLVHVLWDKDGILRHNYVHHRLEDNNQSVGDWSLLLPAHFSKCAIGLARCQRISLQMCCVQCCNPSVHLALSIPRFLH
jgi:hypothetical protein